MRKILGYDVKGKRILLRVDLNSPVIDGKVTMSERIAAHVKTIAELSRRGGRVIVLAHQGREGEPDFTRLEQHAKYLSDLIGKPVRFVPEVIGDDAKKAISSAKDGEIVLLDNVRFLESEGQEDGKIVGELSPLADYFVLDALSVAHRAHASVVGFMKTLPSFYGPVLAEEVSAVSRVLGSENVTFVLGGSKVSDSLGIIERWVKSGKKGKFLIGGALSLLFLKAKGYNIGASEEFLKREGLLEELERAKAMADRSGIHIPADAGMSIGGNRSEIKIDHISEGDLWDIGRSTAEKYAKVIAGSETVVMNGPMGVYEVSGFETGTKMVLEAIAGSKCFSLLGGGHTVSAIDFLRFRKESFGYVSLSGKALVKFLCGEKLPALEALEQNEKKFAVK